MDIQHENIWLVFAVHPKDGSDTIERSLVGKFSLHDGRLDVLEDHVGFLRDLERQPPAVATRKIWSMEHSPYLQLISLEELKQGEHPDLQPYLTMVHGKLEDVEQPKGENVFEYHRQGMEAPQTVTVNEDGTVLLDGHELIPEEVQRLLQNAAQGVATIRYPQDHEDQAMQKMEALLMSLDGVGESGLGRAMQELRKAQKDGRIESYVAEEIARHLFKDTLVPVMGNLKAYRDFLSRPRRGIHVHIDGNQFKSINDTHGHEVGNQAIRGIGMAIRSALDEAIGRAKAKSFRTGGDEFVVHVPTHQEAAHFSRVLRSKLEALPPVGGTHGLSVSMGFGMVPEHAEAALQQAKEASHQANYQPGKAQHHVHSLVPGSEGAL